MKSQMFILTGRLIATLWLCLLPAAHATISLMISPPGITNDFSGKIRFTITGLTNGQQVQLKRFYDVNGNGLIDPGQDFVFQSFKVTDGQLPEIAGVRNLNVPGDDDGITNGQISAAFDYPGLGGPAGAMTGNFIFSLQDQNGVTLAMQVFSVAQKIQPQGVRGRLTSPGSQPLTNSALALINITGPGKTTVVLTDTNGYFNFYAPTGSYSVVSVGAGFVSDENAGYVTVPANQFVTNNIALISGNYSISGTLVDAGSGKPGGAVFVNGESTNNYFAGTFTDTNGFFSFPVIASQWKVKLDEAALAQKSYLAPQSSLLLTITNRSVTNLNFALQKATALIYGTVRDSLSNVVAGISMVADDDQNLYEAIGLTETNGTYTLGVLADNWNAGPNNDSLTAAGYSSGTSTNLVINGGQALAADFILQGVTAHLRGQILDDHGSPITNIMLVVQPYPLQGNGNSALYPTTDGNGNFDVGVSGGVWNLALECVSAQNRGYVDISGLNYSVTNGVDLNGLSLIFPRATAIITGKLTDPVGNPIAGATVDADQPINASGGYFPGCVTTDQNGFYQIQVLNGSWTVSVRNNELNALGYDSILGTNVTELAGTATANFVAPVTLTVPKFTSGGYSTASGAFFTITGDVAHTNTIQFSTNLVNWITLTNRMLTNAIWQAFDPAAAHQKQRFYRVMVAP